MLTRLPQFCPAPAGYSRRWVPPVLPLAATADAAAVLAQEGYFRPVVAMGELHVAAGDMYIAYAPFCRTCRVVGHTTVLCPVRSAAEARALAAAARVQAAQVPQPEQAAPIPAAFAQAIPMPMPYGLLPLDARLPPVPVQPLPPVWPPPSAAGPSSYAGACAAPPPSSAPDSGGWQTVGLKRRGAP